MGLGRGRHECAGPVTTPPRDDYERLRSGNAEARELIRQLLSPKFDPYLPRSRREDLLTRLAPLLELVEIVQQVHACRDPHDDQFLEAAVYGRADVIIAGDKDLLALHPFRGIAILTPAAACRVESTTPRCPAVPLIERPWCARVGHTRHAVSGGLRRAYSPGPVRLVGRPSVCPGCCECWVYDTSRGSTGRAVGVAWHLPA